MKRKLLNAALFGAVLVAAPVSTFVSCADYEEDINSLQKQVDGLKATVDEKVAAITSQIAALEAQDKAFADKLAALEKAQNDCKTNCANELAAAKAECAGARALLQKAIDDLKDALAAAEKKHGEDVASLIAQDGELTRGIEKAQADINALKGRLDNVEGRLDAVEGGLTNTQNDVQQLVEGSKELQTAVKTLQSQVKTLEGEVAKVDTKLADLQKLLEVKIADSLAEAKKYVDGAKAELDGQIKANTTLITNLSKEVKDNKADFDALAAQVEKDIQALKDADAKQDETFRAWIEQVLNPGMAELDSRINDLEGGMTTALGDIQDLKAWCHDLETDVIAHGTQLAALDAQVAKNTKGLLDLAARMVDAELAIADATEKLALLTENYEAFRVAQDALDTAQNVEIAKAMEKALEGIAKANNAQGAADAAQLAANEALAKIKDIVSPSGEYNFDNINKAYKAALEYALQAANTAQANAEAWAKKYADDNFYNKAKVDEFVAALEAADAQQDADFRAWVETVVNPTFATVMGELFDEDGNSRISVLEEGLSNTQKDVMDLSEGLMALTTQVTANTIKIAEIEEAYKAADAKIAADFRAWIEQELNPAFADVYAAIAELGVELSKEVKSFVLEPASYYEGIQAIEGTSYEYTKWNVSDPQNPVQDGDYVKYCPAVTAHYHINPSAAVLSTNVANYSYAVLDRTNRGVNTKLQPVVTAVAQNGGMLDVTLKLTDAASNKTPEVAAHNSEVTVMALQYTNPAAKAENQVVTSDYAVLYLNPLKEVSLVSATNSDHEITDVYAQVVPNNDQDWVEYTSSYDIQEHIAAKFGGENSLSMTELPEGFTVKYTAVGGDVTYFTPITADGKVTPQLPNGKTATTACVGKNATWRIDIMHGDNVVEVGFYKVTITGEAVVETAPAVVTDDILKITCDPNGEDEALNKNLSLDLVWNKIVEVTGEDLATVKGKYSVSMAGDEVAQFEQYTGDNDRVLYKQYAGKGKVTLNADGTVKWIVLDSDPAVESDLRSLTKDMKSMTTYIRVRSNEAISKDTYNEFYMPLVWTPKPIEFWGEYQELSWTYTRVANQWQANKFTREEHELRLYADLTKEGTTDFIYDIPAKAMVDFDATALKFVGTAKNFVNVENGNIGVTDGHFRFIEHPSEAARHMEVTEADGSVSVYDLTVSADGTKLLAAPHKASMTPVVIATITAAGVVELQNNDVTQHLLNAYEKDELDYGQTLCARVGFAAKCRAGLVKVIDGDFDVRFIKPLTVKTDDINISDADDIENAGKITTSILNNIVAFNGYTLAERDYYMKTFGVGIELGDVADWKTNYNAAADDFTKTLAQNHIDDLFHANEAKGEITYTNNTAVVSEFSVIIPVTLHYNWYTTPVAVDIKLNVGRTQGNSHRR